MRHHTSAPGKLLALALALSGLVTGVSAANSEPGSAGAAVAPPLTVAQSDAYRPDRYGDDRYEEERAGRRDRYDDAYRPPQSGGSYGPGSAYNDGPPAEGAYRREAPPSDSYGEPYRPPSDSAGRYDDGPGYRGDRRDGGYHGDRYDDRRTYSQNEIVAAGHGFFGSISQGLASVIEHAFKKAGRPNGYILGEDAGGAFVAGLRYGEGTLHTKDAGTHKVYWQGPSVGYDFGGAGSKTMVLVYNLRDPSDVFHRYAGVEGTAYLVGGVSIQFQKWNDVTMAPIRAGVGLRLGANVGYLKYTRRPTWNPF
ncbi:MAG: EipA family protein [Hyphomicrobiaceae bacterium]